MEIKDTEGPKPEPEVLIHKKKMLFLSTIPNKYWLEVPGTVSLRSMAIGLAYVKEDELDYRLANCLNISITRRMCRQFPSR